MGRFLQKAVIIRINMIGRFEQNALDLLDEPVSQRELAI